MITRFAELRLVENYREYVSDQVVDPLTIIFDNAVGLEPDADLARPDR